MGDRQNLMAERNLHESDIRNNCLPFVVSTGFWQYKVKVELIET